MRTRLFSTIAIVGLLAVAAPRPASAASILFDSIPNPLPINLPSWGFASNQTTELGQEIGLTSGGLFNLSVAALMSNWAYESLFEPLGTSLGYSLAMKLNLYNAPAAPIAPGDAPGSLFASKTVNAFIPWRPQPGGGCPGTQYKGSDGQCYNGSLSKVNFDFGTLNLPSTLIYGLSFNPIGPAASLNFALNTLDQLTNLPLSAGTLPLETNPNFFGSHGFFINTTNPNNVVFATSGAFTADCCAPPTTAVQFTANAPVPEPASMLLAASGLAMIVRRVRRRGQLS